MFSQRLRQDTKWKKVADISEESQSADPTNTDKRSGASSRLSSLNVLSNWYCKENRGAAAVQPL